jgi:hypothetical protein
MNETAASFLKVQLRDALVGAFNDVDFADFIQVEVPKTDFDFDHLPAAWEHKRKVWEAIIWAEQYGGMKFVLGLAEKASAKRPLKDELKQRVLDLKALVEGTSLPKLLAETLAQARAPGMTTWNLAIRFRALLRTQSYSEYDLPGRFHLADALEERLVAVLALEAYPSATYVGWLAERVTVEPPLLAALSAKALMAGAGGLARATLSKAQAAVQNALLRLNDMKYADDPPDSAPFPVNLRAREYLLRVANSLLDVRNGVGLLTMPPEDVDQFLVALIRGFDRAAFSQMCAQHLGGMDRFLAHLSDPIELVVIHVLVQARNIGRVPNLIWGACENQPADVTLKSIRDRFGGPKPPPI